jgi:hypothetical protein
MTALDTLRALYDGAAKERDEDNARWTRLACGQDTEESEESGYLAGRAAGLLQAINLLEESAA